MKLIVFDVGGVFRDSSEAINEGFKRGFRRAGLKYNFNSLNIWRLRGIGKYNSSKKAITALVALTRCRKGLRKIIQKDNAEKILDNLIKKFVKREDEPLIQEIRNEWKKFFKSKESGRFVKTYSNVIRDLNKLSKKYALAIFSNSNVIAIKRDLRKFPLKKFSLIVGEEQLKNKKPYPEGITIICRKLKIKPIETYYIGDCPIDIKTARNAGCKSIALTYGMGTKKILNREKPNLSFDSFESMTKYLMEARR